MRLSSSKGPDYRITYFNERFQNDAVGIYYSVISKQKLDDKVTGLTNDIRDNIISKRLAKSTVKQTINLLNMMVRVFSL